MNNETSFKKQQRKVYYSSRCKSEKVSLLVSPISMLVLEFVEVCVKLVAACSSAKRFQVESVAVDARVVCLGCWLGAL